jgi:phosphoglycolate phosphatase-like HAD superfamily hydrolase
MEKDIRKMLDYHSPGAYEKLKEAKFWVLDLDGTVLYTLEDLANACNEALRIKNYPERSLTKFEASSETA